MSSTPTLTQRLSTNAGAAPRLRSTGLGCGSGAYASSAVSNIGIWNAITRKPMTVPTFHDRWPLCPT